MGVAAPLPAGVRPPAAAAATPAPEASASPAPLPLSCGIAGGDRSAATGDRGPDGVVGGVARRDASGRKLATGGRASRCCGVATSSPAPADRYKFKPY